jgi:hypothetical protein
LLGLEQGREAEGWAGGRGGEEEEGRRRGRRRRRGRGREGAGR